MPTSTSKRYVRKQLSMTREQERAIQRQSLRLGVSEAEVVRRALDAAFVEILESPSSDPLDALLANTRRLAEGRTLGEAFDRAALYDRSDPV